MRCRPNPLLLFLQLLISLCKSDVVEYWNPFDNVMEHIKAETTKMQSFVDQQRLTAKNFIEDQTAKVKEFAQIQKDKIENVFTTSYNEAVKMKSTVDSYVEENKKIISGEVMNYIEGVKETSKIPVHTTLKNVEHKSSLIDYPELVLSVPAIITKNGYICETHVVESQGYLLSVHRIPKSKSRGPVSSKTVILQHGIFASSADWVLNGPEKALAYVLADAGYDVWMTNIRGNKYSREHTFLKTNTKAYWDFSWHEVAEHDVPAVIDYIMEIKGDATKITFIGHSMGTSILFAMLSMRPEYNRILSAAFAFAPIAFMSNVRSPLKNLAPIASNVAYMETLYGSHEFLPKDSVLGKLYTSCNLNSNDFGVCKNVIYYLCGHDEKQLNKSLLPVFISNLGTGTSWKTTVHFAQEIMSDGRFQQFDYGVIGNIKHYGTSKPPEYDLSKITLPITLFWSKNDLLSDEKDVMTLLDKLPTYTDTYMIPFEDFNHLDYLWALDANELLNNKVLDLLSKVFGRRAFIFDFGK